MRLLPFRRSPFPGVVGADCKVPLLSGQSHRYVNFDNAASTPPLKPVWNCLNNACQWYAGVHRSTGAKGYISTSIYEECRQIVLNFVGGNPEKDTVIFVKNTTEALNKLASAWSLSPGSVIVTTKMEHHSNDLPWRRQGLIRRVNLTADGRLDLEHLASLLKSLGSKVKVVAVTGASNVTGYVNDIYSVARLAHSVGAKIVVDAAQLAPHRAIKMLDHSSDRHIDCLALSGHKMYAPFGAGALIAPKSLFKQPPVEVGGGTVSLVTEDQVQWLPAPFREEAGSPNVLGVVAMAKAMQELERVGMETIAEHENQLTDYLLLKLSSMPHVRVYGVSQRQRQDRVGVVTINIAGLDHGQVGAFLGYERGIGVRTGCFCAQPYVQHLLEMTAVDVIKAHRSNKGKPLPGLVRISLGMYNTKSEVDYVLRCLNELSDQERRERIADTYVFDENEELYRPKGTFSPWKHLTQAMLE